MRYFVFFFTHSNGFSFGFGNVTLSSKIFPSRDLIVSEIVKTGRFHPDIAITGFNELSEADYNDWCAPISAS